MSKWEKIRLEEACILNMGQSPDSASYNEEGEGLPFYQGNADFGDLHPKARYYCSKPAKIAHENDVLISVRAPIGAVNIATEECCIGRGLAALTPLHHLDYKYLYYVIKNKNVELNLKGTGSTFTAINRKSLAETMINFPPLEEQKRIADILDKAGNLIDLRKQQLEKMDLLIKSKFIDVFGDPIANPKGWKVEKLEKHISVIGGYAFKSNGFSKQGVPVLRIGNINSGFFKSTNLVFWNEDQTLARYMLKPGDMIISLTGTVGKDDYGNICILGNDYSKYYLNQRNAKLELKNTIDKRYLSNILKMQKIKSKLTDISRGVRQANIANADILNLSIPIPPVELQNQFAAFVEQVEKQKVVMQQSLEKMEMNYKALMQEYFG
jgi:type I restriction enzyme S subunit